LKNRTNPKKHKARPLSYRYAAALRSYLNGSGETALRQAYEVGRSALSAGSGVLDMVQIHLTGQGDVLRKASTIQRSQEILKAASEICLESLSPYEMAHRGFREANAALRHLNELLEREAHRLARELHDEAGQLLAAVHLALEEATHDLPSQQKQRLDRVKEILTEIEGHLRRISHELRPLVLDDLGLGPAIRFLADGVSKRSGLTILAEDLAQERFPAHVELALYRIVQEALTNATKHSRARLVRIELLRQQDSAVCTIRDDGKGFNSAVVIDGNRGQGLGLTGMQERANSLGGTLEIKSVPGKGTLIFVRLPIGS
jgi:signal transduction histidine kinase